MDENQGGFQIWLMIEDNCFMMLAIWRMISRNLVWSTYFRLIGIHQSFSTAQANKFHPQGRWFTTYLPAISEV